ncbi:MAG: ABC transporter permease [Bacteroidaceae bacterium]|nr:ABC transporter permease [Bacteroidaceae bacterium]
MSFEFSIARRLFGHRDDMRRISRPAVTIAKWGVSVGLAVMILSVCIILGFKGEIRRKVIGFGGHVQVINYRTLFSAESQPIMMDSLLMHRLSHVQGIAHVQRFCTKTGMLKTEDAFKGIVLRGVAEEYDTTFLSSHLIAGHLPRFSSSHSSDEIVVSHLIARQLGLKVGQRVYAYFFSETVKARRYLVAGIYETHLKEFDKSLVFTDLYATRKLAGWEDDQCSGAELFVSDFEQLNKTADDVRALVNQKQDAYGASYSVHSIVELYPGIFSWLDLLDTNVYVILVLMIGLSIFTMTAGLLIIILERTNFIAVMKSLGATNGQLRRIFLSFAALLVGQGMFWGNVLGIGLAFVQQQWGLFSLDPATYYVDAVPIQFSWPLILLLNIATLALTVLVLIIPSFFVSRIHPARVMRFE